MKDHIGKYLAHYAVPDIAMSQSIKDKYSDVLVVPCYGEYETVLGLLDSVQSTNSKSPLVILVVNAPVEDPNPEYLGSNNKLLARALPPWVFTIHKQLPNKQGVGLARKIGCDLALALFKNGQIESNFIHSTDADVLLPKDYFEQTYGCEAVAGVHPFEHVANGCAKVFAATQEYERWLHHYVDGLKRAGSPFAHHTIGSTLALNMSAYAKVRGFPRKSAGEDFYILNKLRKIGPIKELKGQTLQIKARLSARAPFGTGPSVAQILAGKPMEYISNKAFESLKEKLQTSPNKDQFDALKTLQFLRRVI